MAKGIGDMLKNLFGRNSRRTRHNQLPFDGRRSHFQTKKGPELNEDVKSVEPGYELPHPDQAQVQTWQENLSSDLILELVLVQAGEYTRGSKRLFAGEKPLHRVIITHPFWIAKYLITQRVHKEITGHNPSFFKDDDRPVEMVNWYEAWDWCQKLTANRKGGNPLPEGYVYRLPTEAEWEYAARSGSSSQSYKYAGSNDVKSVAWYGGARRGNSDSMTRRVGLKAPNKLGLYDMSGNVWEWCYDWYEDYPRTNKLVNPVGPEEGSHRVLRGGSWGYDHNHCRITRRDGLTPEHRYCDVGFRIVLAPELKFFK